MSEERSSFEEKRAAEEASGILHGHIHEQIDEHFHPHIHEQIDPRDLHEPRHGRNPLERSRALTARCPGGLSGDIFLAGLAVLNMELANVDPLSDQGKAWLNERLAHVMPDLEGRVAIVRKNVGGIMGWHANVDLPHEHEHRHLEDIRKIILSSAMAPASREMAIRAFELLASCEGYTHDMAPEEVHFHEVGALDSILDICLDCELFNLLSPDLFICAPLPVADGVVRCAHGLLPAPAPATLRLLQGMPVQPFAGDIASGELVTPTAMALLHAFGAKFGPWPAFTLRHSALVYGTKVFPDAPNGAIFAIGEQD